MSGVLFSETMLLTIKDLRILTWLSVRVNLAHSFGEDRNIVSLYLLHDRSLGLVGNANLIKGRSFISSQSRNCRGVERKSAKLWAIFAILSVAFERIHGGPLKRNDLFLLMLFLVPPWDYKDSQWDSSLFMVLKQAHQARAMATKTPLRTAQSPSYAVSVSVVPSQSPVVVRRALKTRTDKAQVMFSQLTIAFLTCFVLEKERGWWKAV